MAERGDIDFKDMLDKSTDLVHVVTSEGLLLYVNDSWQRTLGYSKEAVLGQSIYSFIAEHRRNDFITFRKEILNNRSVHCAVETLFLAENGQTVPVEGYTSCQINKDGVLFTHSILRDVTKRKMQEKQLEDLHALELQREQRFHQLIQHAPDAVIVIDEFSKIKIWNPKSELLFGWSFDEVEGQPLSETIIPPQYRNAHHEGMKRFLSTGEVHVLNKTIEITALKRSGEEFFIALTISRTFLKNETIFIAFIRDISEQKKMTQEIQQQKEKLEKSNEELSQYASLASHDLKEPIRKILTFSDLLASNKYATSVAHQKQLIGKINAAAVRMEAVIESIAKLSTITSSPAERVPIKLQDVLDEVLANLEEQVLAKKASFKFGLLPSLTMNRTHLYQLFQNLVSNALKYSKPQEPPAIVISVDVPSYSFVRIHFADNGIGFSNQYAQKVFEPFQRLHGNAFSGTGIGLAICKKIVELYNGEISIQSEPGKGSIVSFTLPV